MKKVLPFLLVFFLPRMLLATVRDMDISDAIKNHTVKLSAVNVPGAYMGSAVRLTVTNNNKNDSLNLTVNIGIILKPDDATYQPMVLAGAEKLLLEPDKKGNVDVEVFCGNSPKHCPRKNLHYSYSRMGSDTLIKVLRYINDHSLFDFLGQTAVWAITNNHSLGSVYDQKRDSVSKRLIDVISAATGRPRPEYYTLTTGNQSPGAAAYTSKTLKIIAPFDIPLTTATIISVGVYDKNGKLIEQPVERRLFAKGRHRLDVTFDAGAYSAGTYFIRVMDAARVLREKKVVAEK